MESTPEGRDRTPTTAGAWLRAARQQRGLHIAALAVMLKVPQSKLEALEADRFDELPDATFVRALATAMCRALKVEPAPVLALLPRTPSSEFDMRPGLNQPFRERGAGGPAEGGALALLARPVVWGPLLLLVAAAVVYWIPASWLPDGDTASAPPAAFPPVSAAGTAASAPVDFVPAPDAASVPTAAASQAAPAPAASAPAAVASAPAAVASAPLQLRDVAPPAAAGAALRVTASAESWIEVVDAQGQVLLSRVLRAGEEQQFSGAAPYRVRVGNVSGTQLEWRGAAVDLAARASNNVARLELN